MDPSTEKNHSLYMIGLEPTDSWDEKSDFELPMMKQTTDIEKRIQRFASDMLKQKGIASSIQDAIQRDPASQLHIRRISENNYELRVTYQDSDTKEEIVGTPTEVWDSATYLQGIRFKSDDAAIKQKLMETVGVSLVTMKKGMLDALATLRKDRLASCDEEKRKEWLSCKDDCEKAATLAIKQESGSTAYILRCLASSLLSLEGACPLEVKLKNGKFPSELTGRWENDSSLFRLVNYGAPRKPLKSGRLIMGFGPSASGKTYLATILLNQLRKTDKTLPPCFLSIDGDIYREKSETYTMVTTVANEICAEGFDNLISSVKIFGSLFDSSRIKKTMMAFLTTQTHLPLSLYVPETLGGCMALCSREYQEYIDLTGDREKWIGLMIWQHKTGSECNFPIGFRCKGCTESGIARQKKSGKKYSSDAWERSMEKGNAEFVKAPGGSYKIHNSGGMIGSTSILLDMSTNQLQATKNIFSAKSDISPPPWKYIDHNDAQQFLTGFSQNVTGLLSQSKEFNKMKSSNQDVRTALKITYGDLHSKLASQTNRIYTSLYPESKEVKTIRDSMAEIDKMANVIIDNLSEWKNTHDTLTVKVWFIRHGYSCANAKRNEATRWKVPHGLISDPPLHPKGIRQALALKENIQTFMKTEEKFDLICTSQLYRAIQTGLLIRNSIVQDPVKPIPFHIARYLLEVGKSPDNRPSKITDYTETHYEMIKAGGPMDISTELNIRNRSDIPAFIDGDLRTWLIEQYNTTPDKRKYNVLVVSHHHAIRDTFKTEPIDNCQFYPVTYTFTTSGYLITYDKPTKEELERVKTTFSSSYSNPEYIMETGEDRCDNACTILNDPTIGLNVNELIDIADECVPIENSSE